MGKEPMKKCRYFEQCSAPKCPLDPKIKTRVFIVGDPLCKLDKRTRKQLGKRLKNKGLFFKELNYENSWTKRTEEAKSNTLLNLGKFAFKNIKPCVHEGVEN